MVKVLLPGSRKRQDPPEVLQGRDQKKQKMDSYMKIECRKILITLMTYKNFGPVFSQPVDPVELGIPDYFAYISHPMDLGTVRKKLEDDIYPLAQEFAADIRLTFSNAMSYNPPENTVHKMARELNDLFGRSWRSLESKPIKKVAEQGKLRKNLLNTNKTQTGLQAKTSESKIVKEQTGGVRLKARKPDDSSSLTTFSEAKLKPSVSCEEKARLKKELMVALGGELSGPLRGFLRKYGLNYSKKEKIEIAFASFDDQLLTELKRALKGFLCSSTEQGKDSYVKTPQAKEISFRQKLEEKSNIEARIRAARAAKEAILEGAKSDLQMRRDRERERVEKMKRTVTMDDNLTFLMELEKLCQHSGIKNPLEKIGLRLKEEYYYGYEYIDDDDDSVIFNELEDGEIL